MPIRGLMGYSYWVIVYSDLYTMAQRWLPNFEEFFYSLGRLIENSERQLRSQTCSEYLIRRLDEYERTVSTLLSRLNETVVNLSRAFCDPRPRSYQTMSAASSKLLK